MDTEINSLQTVDKVADVDTIADPTEHHVLEVVDPSDKGLSLKTVGIIGGTLICLAGASYGAYKLIKHIKAKKQNKQNAVEVEEEK